MAWGNPMRTGSDRLSLSGAGFIRLVKTSAQPELVEGHALFGELAS